MSVRSQQLALTASLLFLAAPAAAQDIKPLPAPAQAPVTGPPATTPVATPPARAATGIPSASVPAARPADVGSLDAIVAAMYDVISGNKGVERDWDRFRSLFYPGARMIPTGKSASTGKVNARIAGPEEYIRGNETFLEGEGFHEQELSRRVETFGNIAHVFSAYEARHTLQDEKPFLRGINSIQLFNDGKRWWVMSVAWSPETAEHPLPAQFTQKQPR